MMKKKKGNLLEQHAEKFVLAVAVLISLGLLWFFVVRSPNAVQISGCTLGPGEVDRQVRTQAERLQAKLDEPPVPVLYVPNAKEIFIVKLRSPIDKVPDFRIIGPGQGPTILEAREYSVPAVPPALNAVAESVRGAAHVPVDEVTPEDPYDKTPTTLRDIDLVTVQASFDVAALYRNFKQSFVMGRNVRSDWKDDVLATPVFASAQLQRRRLLDDGRWSDWAIVPRPKIDQYRVSLDVPEKVADLKYDVSMQRGRFEPFGFQQNILQPRPYDFASADTVWLTPSFYQEYVKILDREQKEALRLERERNLGIRGRTPDATRYEGAGVRGPGGPGGLTGPGGRGGVDPSYADARSPRTVNPTGRDRLPGRGPANDPSLRGREGAYDEYGDTYYGVTDPRLRRQQRTANDVVADNMKIVIHPQMKLEELREPMIFWAHDDTVEPGNTYEYRIRLGVFNPIAGKDWFAPQDVQYKDQVILWSAFADVPETVEISPMVHFFPTELARSTENGVLVEVAKYHMGNWRKQDFEVRPGEMIGKTVDLKPQTLPGGRTDAYDEYMVGTAAVLPEKIDFGTGAMLVDVVKTDAWTGLRAMVRSQVIDMLYTRDGLTMLHVPVRKNNWTNDMKVQYGEIDDAAGKPVQVSTARNQSKIDVFRPQASMYPGLYPDSRRGYGPYDRTGEGYVDPGLDRRM